MSKFMLELSWENPTRFVVFKGLKINRNSILRGDGSGGYARPTLADSLLEVPGWGVRGGAVPPLPLTPVHSTGPHRGQGRLYRVFFKQVKSNFFLYAYAAEGTKNCLADTAL